MKEGVKEKVRTRGPLVGWRQFTMYLFIPYTELDL